MKKVALAVLASALIVPAASAATTVKPNAVSIDPGYSVRAVLSVGDRVPETSDPAKQYQMVGIPDGIGGFSNGDGTTTLFLNHEFGNTVQSEPVIGGPLQRGAFVSRYILDADGDPITGERAYDSVFVEDTFVGPAPEAGNSTRGFGRFCSGFLAGPEVGFDRPIYFAAEESDGAATFDGKGGQTVAIFDNEAHALPEQGRFSKENTIVMPNTGNRTVIVSLEDGPASPDSQLWLYVGKKDQNKDATVLERNGLVDGSLFVFVAESAPNLAEPSFTGGTLSGNWVEIPGTENLTDVQLEAAADAAGAMGFIRIEDGAFSHKHKNEFYFVTTGSATGNELGRLYTLKLNSDTTEPSQLHLVYSADQVVASGGDIALSPDNLDVSDDYLMIQEDGTTQSRAVMANKGRDGSIWRFSFSNGSWEDRIDVASAVRVVELDPPGRDGRAVGPGVWETSGIIDASGLLGIGSWIFDVQAHPPTTAPAPNTVEDGQLLVMFPAT
jgi:serralysin